MNTQFGQCPHCLGPITTDHDCPKAHDTTTNQPEPVDMADFRPHFRITAANGDQFVLPVDLLVDIATGKVPVTTIEEFEVLMPTIIGEWLRDTHGWPQ